MGRMTIDRGTGKRSRPNQPKPPSHPLQGMSILDLRAKRKSELLQLARVLGLETRDRRKEEIVAALAHRIPEPENLVDDEPEVAFDAVLGHAANGVSLPHHGADPDEADDDLDDGEELAENGTQRAARPEAVAIPRPAASVHAARRTNGASAGLEEQVERSKFYVGVPTRDLSRHMPKELPHQYGKDRVGVLVRDPYWLLVFWEITPQAVARVEAALAADWYGARPVLRLYDVTAEDVTNASETMLREVEIHGGVNNWYLDVPKPARTYRVDLGYTTSRGRFLALVRSNIVTTPRPTLSHQIDENWRSVVAEYDRVTAMSGGFDPALGSEELRQLFEERLSHPMPANSLAHGGSPGSAHRRGENFHFEVDAELIIYGAATPGTRILLQGAPIQTRADGSFTLRMSLPEGRQIIPAVAHGVDGNQEQTIILAVERNTKTLEPLANNGKE